MTDSIPTTIPTPALHSDTAVGRITKKKRQCWRTGGWSPLAYPASSLLLQNNVAMSKSEMSIQDATVNPFFPLDKDVLRAAVREMLICEGSVAGDSLAVMKEANTRFVSSHENHGSQQQQLGPRYTPHVMSGAWIRQKENHQFLVGGGDSDGGGDEGSSYRLKKRKLQSTGNNRITASGTNKKLKTFAPSTNENLVVSSMIENQLRKIVLPTRIHCAEALVDIIVDRARLSEEQVLFDPILAVSSGEAVFSQEQQRPPRKVSDSDGGYVSDAPILLDLTDETCGEQDISLFVDLTNRSRDGCVTFRKQAIPAFLDIPIVFESAMKSAAYRMLTQMLATFENESIGRFLGYKSCNLERERILRIVSDYLFDVSHAMFAWKQTESEILSEKSETFSGTVATQFCQELDSMVRDALFDERALKKIGGFDESSILRHAIEISRSERKKETWERFAKTVTGSRLLHHHKSGRAYLVGLRRRGQRMKRISSNNTATSSSTDGASAEDGPRSRSSSIASFDEEIVESAAIVRHADPAEQQQQQPTHTNIEEQSVTTTTTQHHDELIAPNLSEVSELTLTRKPGKSWGVLLSREGDMCVVVRGSGNLRCGDLVLSVKSQHGEAASPSSFWSARDPDWFKDIVNMFKESDELQLSVRRVGC